MPNRKNTLILLLVSLTVIASGCVDNGENGEVDTNPVAITDFYPAQSTIPADTNLALNVEMENSGDTDAENPVLRLSGPTFSEDSDDGSAWRKQGPEAMSERPDRTFEMNDIRSSDGGDVITTVESITLLTPSYDEGRAPTESFDAELFYGYETRASTQVTAMTEEQSVEANQESSTPEVDNDSGPVQMEVLSRSPIVHYPGTDPDSCGLEVMVRNEGPGTPFDLDAYDEGTEDKYLVESDHEDVVELEVSGQSPFEGDTKEVELVHGEARACFEWPSDEGLSQDEQSINIDMTASYGYHTEEQTSVTVEGRSGLNGE